MITTTNTKEDCPAMTLSWSAENFIGWAKVNRHAVDSQEKQIVVIRNTFLYRVLRELVTDRSCVWHRHCSWEFGLNQPKSGAAE